MTGANIEMTLCRGRLTEWTGCRVRFGPILEFDRVFFGIMTVWILHYTQSKIFNHLKVWNATRDTVGHKVCQIQISPTDLTGWQKEARGLWCSLAKWEMPIPINVSQFDLKHPLPLKCQILPPGCLETSWHFEDFVEVHVCKGRYLEDHRWWCRLHPREGRQNQRKVPWCNKFFCHQEMDGINQQFFLSPATDCTGPIPVVWPPWMFSVRIARVSGAEIELFERDLILASWTQHFGWNHLMPKGSTRFQHFFGVWPFGTFWHKMSNVQNLTRRYSYEEAEPVTFWAF